MPSPNESAGFTDLASLIEAARGGCPRALGRLLEMCRTYLLAVANRTLPAELCAKVGASDLVQETFVQAQKNFQDFRGSTEAELLGWLRRILLNNVANLSRAYRDARKREVGREVSVDELPREMLAAETPADSESPGVRLAVQEEEQHLHAALEQLPEHYRQVVQWRNFECLPFAEIGARLGRSEEAVRKLWTRALEELSRLLEPPDDAR